MLQDRTINIMPIFIIAMGPLYLSINSLFLGLVTAFFMLLLVVTNIVLLYPLRHLFPSHLRLLVLLIVNSSLVVLLHTMLQAYAYPLQQQLGLYLPMICINCFVLTYAESLFKIDSLRPFLKELVAVVFMVMLSLVIFGACREILASYMLMADISAYLGVNVGGITLLERTNGLALFDSAAGVIFLLGLLSAVVCALAKRFTILD